MYSVVKGVVWVCYMHLTPFAILWFIGALSTSLYYVTLQCKKEAVLSLIPGVTTAVRLTLVTERWYFAIPGFIACMSCFISWNPILTLMYCCYVMVVNSVYTKQMFPTSVWALSPLGWYKCIFEWKEVITWLRLNRETHMMKTTSSTKTQKKVKTPK